jgi:hypothetical protein
MPSQPPFFEDLSKLALSAGATMMEWRKEVEKLVQAQCEKWVRGMDLVTREEFEVVRELAQKALQENETLKEKLEAMENAGSKAKNSSAKKAAPAAKKAAAKADSKKT